MFYNNKILNVACKLLKIVKYIVAHTIRKISISLIFSCMSLMANAGQIQISASVGGSYPGYAPGTLNVGLQATSLTNVANIKIYDNNALVGTMASLASPVITLNNLVGTHNVYATATDANGSYTSPIVTFTFKTPYPSMTSSYSRASAFDYDPITGLLTKEIIEPDDPNSCLVTIYTYDNFGNRNSATTRNCNGTAGSQPGVNSEASAPSSTSTDFNGNSIANPAIIVARTTSSVYDSQGRFATSSTNALGQSETRAFNSDFGTVASLTGPNGLSTSWTYDSFGKQVKELRADGTSTSTTYTFCNSIDSNCIANTQYTVTRTQPGAPTSIVSYNIHDAVIQTSVQDKDSNYIFVQTNYDNLGRQVSTTRPFKTGGSLVQSSVTYDILGRVTNSVDFDQTASSVTYGGLSTVYTNSKGQTRTEVKNTLGQLITVKDYNGSAMYYTYDPFDNLIDVGYAFSNEFSGLDKKFYYDKRGRKIYMSDPEMGVWLYQYDVLGQLISQQDAKGNLVTFNYDNLGRMTSRNEPDMKSVWNYDTCDQTLNPGGKCIGKMVNESSDNGFVRTYLYDAYSRLTAEKDNVDSAYYVTKSFDSYGRVANIVYPSSLQISYNYSASGLLSTVSDTSTGLVYWSAGSTDAEGRVNQFTYGNHITTTSSYDLMGRVTQINAGSSNAVSNQSYVYDNLGNITQRYDGVTGLNEAFGYDSLNRLISTSAQAGSGPLTQVSLTYSAGGSIKSKSDIGTYTYGTKVNQVSSILMTDGVTPYATYSYDANGNMITGAGRQFTWTSWNMVSSIVGSSPAKSTPSPQTHARYIMIKRNDEPAASTDSNTQGLVLAEVKVLNSAGTDLALNTSVTSSPAYSASYTASRAVDGVTSDSGTSFFMGTSDNTATYRNAWMQIDLGSVQSISQITTLGRTDSATWQNGLFTVFWSDQDMRGLSIDQLKAKEGVGYYIEATQASSTTVNITSNSSTYSVVYNSNHERIKETLPDGTVVFNISPRMDTGIHVEKRIKPDSSIQISSSLYAGDMPFATVTTTTKTIVKGPFPNETLVNTKVRYFHKDHLGTIVAISDETGTVVERRSYDAWGKRRNLNGTSMNNAFVTPDERHGFAGQEEWDDIGLINMNGRLYDPAIGRFMSADPTIQMPDDIQNHNRYSYINNNPLSAVDYSGYGWFSFVTHIVHAVTHAVSSVVTSVVKAVVNTVSTVVSGAVSGVTNAVGSALSNTVIRTAASIALAITLGPESDYALIASADVGGDTAAAIANTAVSGFSSGLVAGRGDLNAAIQGAVTSVAFYGVGEAFTAKFENTLAHAAVGCAASVASGGSCKAGALSGGISAAAANYNVIQADWGRYEGAAASGVIGGTASVLGGGSFQNGAMTGAFGYLFNCLSHPGACNKSDIPELLSDNRVKAFMSTLAQRESGGDYYSIVGGGVFSDDSMHPNIYVSRLNSTAAGAYQITYPTWLDVSKAMSLNDFSPASQNTGAAYLLLKLKVMDAIIDDNMSLAVFRAAKRWDAFPLNSSGRSISGGSRPLAPILKQILDAE